MTVLDATRRLTHASPKITIPPQRPDRPGTAHHVAAAARKYGGLTVVDVAAGTGRWARALQRKRGARAIAVDFCHEMLRIAPIPAVQADATHLPLPDASADVVICAFALGYAPACFAELARITRPGGMLLVSDVHPEALSRGWTRSFRHRGEAIQVRDQPYELADLACARSSVVVLARTASRPAGARILRAGGPTPPV